MARLALFLLGVTFALLSTALAPNRARSPGADDDLVLPAGAARVLALGRNAAAADSGWLVFVQTVGSSEAERRGYPFLERWLEMINELAPRYEVPYYAGAVLLATTAERGDAARAAIERARDNLDPAWCRRRDLCPTPALHRDLGDYYRERCRPCEALEACPVDTELWQGFVNYFGTGDTAAAADHFCEARRRGGAQYLGSFAARVASQSRDCGALANNLGALAGSGATSEEALLRSRVLPMLESCVRGELKRAIAAFKLAKGRRPADLEELVSSGYTEPPAAPPGRCWRLAGTTGELEECAR